MSKFHKTKNYKGPSSSEDEPMNETMVKLILSSAGFKSAAEVRAVVKKENAKNQAKTIINYDAPAWIKRSDRKAQTLHS